MYCFLVVWQCLYAAIRSVYHPKVQIRRGAETRYLFIYLERRRRVQSGNIFWPSIDWQYMFRTSNRCIIGIYRSSQIRYFEMCAQVNIPHDIIFKVIRRKLMWTVCSNSQNVYFLGKKSKCLFFGEKVKMLSEFRERNVEFWEKCHKIEILRKSEFWDFMKKCQNVQKKSEFW